MAYTRKTIDEYEIQGDYGQGFECVSTEATRASAKENLRLYRQNEQGILFRLIKKRVKKA